MDPGSENMLMEAIAAARAGNRVRARSLLTKLLRADSSVVDYWIWMSAVVDSKREKIYCLESALKLDPTNRAALRGLTVLGARAPQEAELASAPRISRRQMPSVATGPALGKALGPALGRALQVNWRLAFIGAVGFVGLIIVGGLAYSFFTRPRALPQAAILPSLSPTHTATASVPSATPSPLPASVRALRTPIPTELAGTPIIFFVPQTPTPTSILGFTPHPQFEAYSAGVEALTRANYTGAAAFFEQVLELDESLPDAHYLLAESLRLQAAADLESEEAGGLLGQALAEYDRAILLDTSFAAAYLGRGRTVLLRTLRANNPEDIKAEHLPQDYARAIEADPQLSEAYVAQADFYRQVRLWKTMEETLQAAIDAGLSDPILYIRLSEAQINREKYDLALENAIEGSASDPTLLDGYLMLGRSLVRLELFDEALAPLHTYVAYRGEDHRGWSDLGRAQLGVGDHSAAWESLVNALERNDRYAPAYLALGWLNFELGDYEAGMRAIGEARRFGAENYELFLALGYAHYYLGNYQEGLNNANSAINIATEDERKAVQEKLVSRAYALRALISEAAPDLLDYAIQNWEWILSLEFADPETVAMAEEHLAELTGEVPTRIPSGTPTRTLTPSATIAGPETATITPSPSATPTPSPSPSSTPPSPTSTRPVTATPSRTPTVTPTPSSTSAPGTTTPTTSPTPTPTQQFSSLIAA